MSIDQAPPTETRHDSVMNYLIGVGQTVRRAEKEDLVQAANSDSFGLPYVLAISPAGNCSTIYIEQLGTGEQYTLIPDARNPLNRLFAGYADEVRFMVPLGLDELRMRTIEHHNRTAPHIGPAIPVNAQSDLRVLESYVTDLRPLSLEDYQRMQQAYEGLQTEKRQGFGSRILSFFKK
jgi:hypothetical protein